MSVRAGRAGLLQCPEQLSEHLPNGRVVVPIAGVGGHFGMAVGRIALAEAILVAYGANYRRAGLCNQLLRVETLFDVALHVSQRRLIAVTEPVAEPCFVVD